MDCLLHWFQNETSFLILSTNVYLTTSLQQAKPWDNKAGTVMGKSEKQQE
jgi:hypothetical protein